MLVALLKFAECALRLQFLCFTTDVFRWCCWIKRMLKRTPKNANGKMECHFPLNLPAHQCGSQQKYVYVLWRDRARKKSARVRTSQNEQWQYMCVHMYEMRIESKTINIKGHLFRFKCCHQFSFALWYIFGIFEFKTNLTLDIRFYWTWTCSCTPSHRRSHYSVCQ